MHEQPFLEAHSVALKQRRDGGGWLTQADYHPSARRYAVIRREPTLMQEHHLEPFLTAPRGRIDRVVGG
jgi:hypothetical protein